MISLMEAKRQDIGMDIDENKKDTQNKTNTQKMLIRQSKW